MSLDFTFFFSSLSQSGVEFITLAFRTVSVSGRGVSPAGAATDPIGAAINNETCLCLCVWGWGVVAAGTSPTGSIRGNHLLISSLIIHQDPKKNVLFKTVEILHSISFSVWLQIFLIFHH